MTKRARGSVYQRKADGRWVASLPVIDPFTRRRRQETRYARPNTKDAAEVLLAQMVVDDERGTLITENMRFDVFAERWLTEVKKPTVTESTYITYRRWWKSRIKGYFKTMLLRDITPQVVHDWQHRLVTGGEISIGYITSLQELLGQCLSQAETWNLIARNPVELVRSPRKGAGANARPKELKVWTPDEVRAFLTHVKGHDREPMYAIALMLGVRLGELLGLRWCDVDFDAAMLTVGGQYTQRNERTDTKSHQTRRLDMPRSLVTLLRACKQKRVWEAQHRTSRWDEGAYIFAMPHTGRPPAHPTMERWFKEDSAAAKVRVSSFHLLRHTAASTMHARGVPMLTISKVLGHSSPTITQTIYTHIFAPQMKEAADVMDDLLGGVVG